MSEHKKSGISFFNANFTLIISVSLVLLLFGTVAMMGIAGYNLSQHVKENIGFDIIIKETATEQQINSLKQYLNKAEYVSSVKYISKENALMIWEKETGEDLMATLGVNPLLAEFEVNVKSKYASVDSLDKITHKLSAGPAIQEIVVQRDVIEKVNRNITNVAIVLSAVALVLLIISIALINNTMRLSVYSKRFLIHTMKLVGATPGFIRRPFVKTSVVNGIISGVLADALLLAAIYYGMQISEEASALLSAEEIAYTLAAVVLTGIILCSCATFFAANKYLKLNYDELFKR